MIRKRIAQISRGVRLVLMVLKGLVSTSHPMLVTLIATRRCNLSCGYCNEYDEVSKPVPLDAMFERVDSLARLGTAIVTISGGEPLLQPGLDQIVRRIRRHGIIATVITNGYLLTERRINELNDAGLDYLQISIDNVKPDDVSMKSLKVLDQKLVLLSRLSRFSTNVNCVIGGGIKNPEDALVVAERARKLGLSVSVGVIHDGEGQARPLTEQEQRVYTSIRGAGGRSFAILNRFQDKSAAGEPNDWRCRAGARYFYVDEFGLVHWCSQQRGYPAAPLQTYSTGDIRREYLTEKSCAPYCTIACVHRASTLDNWRDRQTLRKRLGVAAQVSDDGGAELGT